MHLEVHRWYAELGDYYEWKQGIEENALTEGGELIHVVPGFQSKVIKHGTLAECRDSVPEGLTEEIDHRDIPEPEAATSNGTINEESSE